MKNKKDKEKKVLFIDIWDGMPIFEDSLKNFSRLPMVDEDIICKDNVVRTVFRVLHGKEKDILFVRREESCNE